MTITQLNTARYHGLGITDLQILLLLAENGRTCMTDLAMELALTESAITVASRRLVAKHLIKKVDSRGDVHRDRRIVMLDLCDLGRIRIHQITGTFPEPAKQYRCSDCDYCGPTIENVLIHKVTAH